MKKEALVLTQEWDKTFPKSDKVDHSKVTFVNRYGITLAGDLYAPKGAAGQLPAIAVCGPFGAVKEQPLIDPLRSLPARVCQMKQLPSVHCQETAFPQLPDCEAHAGLGHVQIFCHIQ